MTTKHFLTGLAGLLFMLFLVIIAPLTGLYGDKVYCEYKQPQYNTSDNEACFTGEVWACHYCKEFNDCPTPPYNNPICTGEES